TALPAAAPRWYLRGRDLEPRKLPGDPPGEDRAAGHMAESLCRTPHRTPATRVPSPCHRPQRDPPASPAARLPHLLPPLPNPPLTGKGRSGAETGGSPRPGRYRRDAHGRRPASLVLTAGCVGLSPPTLLTGHAEGAGLACST